MGYFKITKPIDQFYEEIISAHQKPMLNVKCENYGKAFVPIIIAKEDDCYVV